MAGEEDKILEGARFCSLALCATTICVGQKVAVKLVCLKLGTLGQVWRWRGDAQPGCRAACVCSVLVRAMFGMR